MKEHLKLVWGTIVPDGGDTKDPATVEYLKLVEGSWVARFNGRDFLGRIFGSRADAERAVRDMFAALKV
jgi:hypothetical protein